MKGVFYVVLFITLPLITIGVDVDINQQSALSLAVTNIYTDSTFEASDDGYFLKGELLQIIDKTENDYNDADENQKFYWYYVKNNKGKKGWIFGEELAVIVPKENLPIQCRKLQALKTHFKDGFDSATVWFAELSGRENIYEGFKDYLNPNYTEVYLVITNNKSQSVSKYLYGGSVEGKVTITQFYFRDITSDQVPDFLIERTIVNNQNQKESKDFKVMGIQVGGLVNLFEEKMSFNLSKDNISPRLYKYIEIDESGIRIEYVDFIPSENCLELKTKDYQKEYDEYCIKYVVNYYVWDKEKNTFLPFYAPSISWPTANIKTLVDLQAKPNLIPYNKTTIKRLDELKVLKYSEKIDTNNKIIGFFYVKIPGGRRGYVSHDKIHFKGFYHAELLNQYFALPYTRRHIWKPKVVFCNILSSVASEKP